MDMFFLVAQGSKQYESCDKQTTNKSTTEARVPASTQLLPAAWVTDTVNYRLAEQAAAADASGIISSLFVSVSLSVLREKSQASLCL